MKMWGSRELIKHLPAKENAYGRFAAMQDMKGDGPVVMFQFKETIEPSERFIGSRKLFGHSPNMRIVRSFIIHRALTNRRKLMQYGFNSTRQILDLNQAFTRTLTACCC
jgi:cystathionine beta-lyase/cystathionine gamma-synthase